MSTTVTEDAHVADRPVGPFAGFWNFLRKEILDWWHSWRILVVFAVPTLVLVLLVYFQFGKTLQFYELDSTPIEARLSAAASAGPISGKITAVSIGGDQGVGVSGTVNATAIPTLTTDLAAVHLGFNSTGTAGMPQSFAITGSSLVGNVVVAAPAGIELSSDGGKTWHDSLTLSPSNGVLTATNIAARTSSSASPNLIKGKITAASTGAAPQEVNLTAIVTPVTMPTITVSANYLVLGVTTAETPGAPQSFTLRGSSLKADVVVAAPSGVELSADGGSTWHSSLTLTPARGAIAPFIILGRTSAQTEVGSITGQITCTSTGAVEQSIHVVGGVYPAVAPRLTANAATLNLGAAAAGSAGVPQSYSISGSNLTGSVVITAPTGVELSADHGATWRHSLTLTPGRKAVIGNAVKIKAATHLLLLLLVDQRTRMTVLLIFIVIFSTMGLLTVEKSTGTLAWNLTKPLGRTGLFLSKWIVAVVAIWLAMCVLPITVASICMMTYHRVTPDFAKMAPVVAGSAAWISLWVLLVLTISLGFNSQGAVGGITIAFWAVPNILGFLLEAMVGTDVKDWILDRLATNSPFFMPPMVGDPEIFWPDKAPGWKDIHLYSLIGWTVALLGISLRWFNRQEVGS